MVNNILPAPSVCFENVCLSRGGTHILEGICATAPAGGSTVIVGPNGAGKTTLLLCLIGEILFTGRIELTGAGQQPRVAYVPQHLSMDRSLPLRVSEFMALSCQRKPLWLGLRPFARAEGRRLLQMVKAEHLEQSRMGDLSGGELRRVLLAAALGRNPELLVLDEPTSGLDPVSRRDFYALLDGLAAEGASILLSSHALTEVEARTDRILILSKGRMVAEGSLADLRRRADLPVMLHVTPRPGAGEAVAAALPGAEPRADGLVLSCGQGEKLAMLARIAALGDLVADLDVAPPSLEDLYSHFSKRDGQ